MTILQRHIPEWDTKTAIAQERRIFDAKEEMRAGYEAVFVMAQALCGLDSCKKSARDIFDYGRDLVEDSVSPEEAEHVDCRAIAREVWDDGVRRMQVPRVSVRDEILEGLRGIQDRCDQHVAELNAIRERKS